MSKSIGRIGSKRKFLKRRYGDCYDNCEASCRSIAKAGRRGMARTEVKAWTKKCVARCTRSKCETGLWFKPPWFAGR